MTQAAIISPLHDWFAEHGATLTAIEGRAYVDHLGDADAEADAVADLAIADVTPLPKLSVKGPRAIVWLSEKNLGAPRDTYASSALPGGGVVIRTGGDEVFIEGATDDGAVAALSDALGFGLPGVSRIERQDCGLRLTGARSYEVLAQTSGINFAEREPGIVVFTRVAGVSACVLPEAVDPHPVFRIWFDCSYAIDLWHALVEIVHDEGGRVVGTAAVLP